MEKIIKEDSVSKTPNATKNVNMKPATSAFGCEIKQTITVMGINAKSVIAQYNLKSKNLGISAFLKLKCFLIHLGGME